MRRDVTELANFYASPLGFAARAMVAAKIAEAWNDVSGLDLLGLGYATPFLDPYHGHARRVVATMPAAQGVEVWPAGDKVCVCLGDERALPFRNAFFDRILMVHALEESDNDFAALAEACRVLAPAGRLMVVAANRRGGWSNAEATPFGHGKPFTRAQLERLLREAGLEPVAWSRALYAPPWDWTAGWAETFEQVGARLWPIGSGVLLIEAVKHTFAVRPKGARAPVIRIPSGGFTAPGLQPAPGAGMGGLRKTAAPAPYSQDREPAGALAAAGEPF